MLILEVVHLSANLGWNLVEERLPMISRSLDALKDFMRKQNPNYRVLTVRGISANFAWGLTQNYTSIYTVELGADPIQLGSLRGIGDLVNVFLSAPVGWFADKYSLKKMFVFGLALEALMALGYAFSWNWQMLVIPVVFFSMTMITTWSIERVLLANALKRKDRATGFGVLSMISQLPMIIAPTLGGIIVTWLGGLSAEAIRPLYYISFALSSLMLLWVCWKLQEPKTRLKQSQEGFIESFRRVLAGKKEIKRWLLIELLGSFTFGSTMPFIMVYAAEIKHADAMLLGFMGSAMTIVSMLSSVPFGKMADKIGRKKTIMLLRPTLYASYLLLIWAPRPEFLILAFALRGILWSTFNVWMTMKLEMVPMDQRGRWTGAINTFRSIVRIPAPVIGGILWTYVDPSIPFLLLILIDALIRMPLLLTIPDTLEEREPTVQ